MRRREFITLLGGATTWPLSARAQQSAMPLIGFLASASSDGYAWVLPPLREGLAAAGYVEGRNLTIEYRWADDQYDRLPTLVAKLVRRQVAVIFVTGGVVSAVAAKSSTTVIPIVFVHGSDPVRYGLVSSFNRPGGNVTGLTFHNSALGPKRIGLLRDVVPRAAVIAVLVNPTNPNASPDAEEMQDAGRSIGVKIEVVHAGSERELDGAFAEIVQLGADALIAVCGQQQASRGAGREIRRADDVPNPPIHLARGPNQLRNRPCGRLSPSRSLCRADTQGRETRRPAGASADQIRSDHQSQDC
jgi:putative tryptophan/tyrosine transport system substrate-binding protein